MVSVTGGSLQLIIARPILRRLRRFSRWQGGPTTVREVETLVVRMAEENRTWGYRRIQGALANLGHEIAGSTIAAILERHGLEPAPDRSPGGLRPVA